MLFDDSRPLSESCRDGVIAIGNFDGVHRGHRHLLGRLRRRADELDSPAVVVSFQPHPLRLLRPDLAPIPLTWPERKVELLKAAGADEVVLLNVTEELLAMAAEEFFLEVVRGGLRARGMVEGPDFRFGRGRQGNIDLLARLCQQASIRLEVVDAVTDEGTALSSTRIRECLSTGEVVAANAILGRPHRFRGQVVAGDRRGRTLGFPTANLDGIDVMLPADGVYAVRVFLDNQSYAGACNVGPAPTFGVTQRQVEIHLLDFDHQFYGATLEVELITRLRATRSFAGPDDLRQQLAKDILATREALCE